MKAAGEYIDRLEWLQRSTAGRTLDGFGQASDPFASQGFLWGVVEDLRGGRVTEQASEHDETTATIRLRNSPAVVAGDRLVDLGRGEAWRVLSVTRGVNEVLCGVTDA
jgi:head-tail adaptor